MRRSGLDREGRRRADLKRRRARDVGNVDGSGHGTVGCCGGGGGSSPGSRHGGGRGVVPVSKEFRCRVVSLVRWPSRGEGCMVVVRRRQGTGSRSRHRECWVAIGGGGHGVVWEVCCWARFFLFLFFLNDNVVYVKPH